MTTGKSATDEEIAKQLGLSTDEYADWQGQVKVTNVISLNEFVETSGTEPVSDAYHNSQFIQPEDNIAQEELTQKLDEALKDLTEKEKQVILLYYYEEMTLKEIAAILSVTESRVSQLHTKAIGKMRKTLGDYMGILTGN